MRQSAIVVESHHAQVKETNEKGKKPSWFNLLLYTRGRLTYKAFRVSSKNLHTIQKKGIMQKNIHTTEYIRTRNITNRHNKPLIHLPLSNSFQLVTSIARFISSCLEAFFTLFCCFIITYTCTTCKSTSSALHFSIIISFHSNLFNTHISYARWNKKCSNTKEEYTVHIYMYKTFLVSRWKSYQILYICLLQYAVIITPSNPIFLITILCLTFINANSHTDMHSHTQVYTLGICCWLKQKRNVSHTL